METQDNADEDGRGTKKEGRRDPAAIENTDTFVFETMQFVGKRALYPEPILSGTM